MKEFMLMHKDSIHKNNYHNMTERADKFNGTDTRRGTQVLGNVFTYTPPHTTTHHHTPSDLMHCFNKSFLCAREKLKPLEHLNQIRSFPHSLLRPYDSDLFIS